ncbi:M28 family peptidase [Streptomyces sp. NPDC088725]|uniref:M28 family peptidase n=1 Tax=Streptomyces sp. NPDC088725 TaxID=3365873 RepID=UPI003827AF63
MNGRPRRSLTVAAAVALAVPLLLSAAPAATDVPGPGSAPVPGPGSAPVPGLGDPGKSAAKLSRQLVRKTSAEDAYRHLRRFQAIAGSAGGNRAAGSPGHEASAAYVHDRLKEAGYQVSYGTFDFTYVETLAEKLTVTAPETREVGIAAMSYTASTPEGGLTAELAVVTADGTAGCEPADYTSAPVTGKIALIKRGGCAFSAKQRQAANAGAVGAIIYNNTDGALSGTLGDPAAAAIPTGGITQEAGKALAAEAEASKSGSEPGGVTVTLDLRQFREQRTTRNVIAETGEGRADRTVMLGAHLDSVTAGPGINDNGSGSAGLLAVALELAKIHAAPTNKVRFAWWSAEELGLLGSGAYVTGLTPGQRADIALYLNFDMIASPNYAELVYDGDDSDATGSGPGPEGSAQLEKGITDFLDRRNVPHRGADFDGRSDYGPFMDAGIPSGGTFTGAEDIKSAAEAETYGGEAGVAYDACYHSACDDLTNIDMKAFGINVGVIADAVGTYAHDLGPLAKGTSTTSARSRTAGPPRSRAAGHQGTDNQVAGRRPLSSESTGAVSRRSARPAAPANPRGQGFAPALSALAPSGVRQHGCARSRPPGRLSV